MEITTRIFVLCKVPIKRTFIILILQIFMKKMFKILQNINQTLDIIR